MKFKRSLLIFIIGILTGLSLRPLVNETPKEAIISPILPSMAQTKDLLLPITEGEVLGFNNDNHDLGSDMVNNKAESVKGSKFAALIDKIELKEQNKASSSSKTTKKDNNKNKTEEINPSAYRGKLTIAVFGDSMTDLMGTNLPYLASSLKKYYPQAECYMYNYGVGAQNIETGLKRLEADYNYHDRNYPPLTSIDADIIVVESFAYNPFETNENELDRQWSALNNIVDILKNKTRSKIIIMSTIAPSATNFGQGPGGVNWSSDLAWQHAVRIGNYLDNAIKYAKEANLPFADIYHLTLQNNNEGNPNYINANDHIHQSIAGNKFIADILAQKIYNTLDF